MTATKLLLPRSRHSSENAPSPAEQREASCQSAQDEAGLRGPPVRCHCAQEASVQSSRASTNTTHQDAPEASQMPQFESSMLSSVVASATKQHRLEGRSDGVQVSCSWPADAVVDVATGKPDVRVRLDWGRLGIPCH